MRLGAVYPQNELGTDPIAIRDFAQAVEGLGYHSLNAVEHVILPGQSGRQGNYGEATNEQLLHEPLTLFAYLAGVTTRLEMATGVLILPQRQTVLVAKQAAEVDLLTGGRLRLGVGVGWVPEEFAALGADYRTRGVRCDEQIALLRALWTEPLVTFHGRWHEIKAAGINPLPVQRPIPIWVGGRSDAALKRAGSLGDGWIALPAPPDATARDMVDRLRGYAAAAGRSADAVEIEAWLSLGSLSEAEWGEYAEGWRSIGATRLAVDTIGAGYTSPDQHIAALRRLRESLP